MSAPGISTWARELLLGAGLAAAPGRLREPGFSSVVVSNGSADGVKMTSTEDSFEVCLISSRNISSGVNAGH